tara:strand:- start:379 stop:1239 length:861 start_codon:yes stop_codon:yes gene_type:complete
MTSISILFSQGISDYSYNSAESSSLAGSIVSIKGDTWSLFNNPASLVEIQENKFSIGYSHLYNQKYLPMSSIGLVISKYDINFGVKYNSFQVDYKGVELLRDDQIGFVSAIDLMRDKNSSLSVGVSTNLYMMDFAPSAGVTGDGSFGLSDSKVTTFGLDIGLLATLRNKNRLGVFIKNINSPSIGRGISSQKLPRKIDLGLSTMPSENFIITFSFEQLLGNKDAQFKTSFKYQLSKVLVLNTGVQMNPNRFGIGFILNKKSISLSYAFLTHHILPGTHQCNVGMKF